MQSRSRDPRKKRSLSCRRQRRRVFPLALLAGDAGWESGESRAPDPRESRRDGRVGHPFFMQVWRQIMGRFFSNLVKSVTKGRKSNKRPLFSPSGEGTMVCY